MGFTSQINDQFSDINSIIDPNFSIDVIPGFQILPVEMPIIRICVLFRYHCRSWTAIW